MPNSQSISEYALNADGETNFQLNICISNWGRSASQLVSRGNNSPREGKCSEFYSLVTIFSALMCECKQSFSAHLWQLPLCVESHKNEHVFHCQKNKYKMKLNKFLWNRPYYISKYKHAPQKNKYIYFLKISIKSLLMYMLIILYLLHYILSIHVIL